MFRCLTLLRGCWTSHHSGDAFGADPKMIKIHKDKNLIWLLIASAVSARLFCMTVLLSAVFALLSLSLCFTVYPIVFTYKHTVHILPTSSASFRVSFIAHGHDVLLVIVSYSFSAVVVLHLDRYDVRWTARGQIAA